jgi:hypothetical protein
MLTEQRIDAIFKEMDGYVLELANEPGLLGPQYFQDIIATCRGHLNKVSLVVSELNREKLSVSGELRRLEAVYALEYDNLLSNDPRVKALASIEDRKATVGFILRDQRVCMNTLKDRMHSLDAVGKLVAYRNRELHATMTAIKDQRRLMQTELATGAFYGDERSFKGQREGNGLSFDDDLSAADLEDLISPSEPEAENAADPEATGVLDLENPQETGVVASAPVAPQGFVSSPVATSTAAADDMLLFLEGAVPDVPQAVVGQPKNTISVVEQSSEVDDFLSILGTL